MTELYLRVRELSLASRTSPRHSRLSEVSFDLPQRGITLVIGQTGAGKSTLLQVLAGLEAPSQGTVTYGHHLLWKNGRANPRVLRQLGLVFQYPEHQLFAQTVRQEFLYSLKPYQLNREETESRIHTALSALNLEAQVLQDFPLTLSGGQKRRVALATTLATKPEWLLLDEPTAGLDVNAQTRFVSSLSRYVEEPHRAIVVASHDLDLFLPLATTVLVLVQGRLAFAAPPAELVRHAEVLLQAGIGLPNSVQLSLALAKHGLTLTNVPLSVNEMAAILAPLAPLSEANLGSESILLPERAADLKPDSHPEQPDSQPGYDLAEHTGGGPGSLLGPKKGTFDVRAKWLFYILISAGILVQGHWWGVLAASALSLSTLLVSRINLWRVGRLLRPVLYLAAVSVLLSGLQVSLPSGGLWHTGLGFSSAAATETFMQMWKLGLLLTLGVWFTSSTSQLEIKQALVQIFSGLSRFGIPVQAFALGTSLLLRFIPVLAREQQRLAGITQARGKSGGKPGRLRMRDLRAFTIPLILSLFQLGEDLATAMEARGCTHVSSRAHPVRFAWPGPRDIAFAFLGMLCAIGLWVIR